MIDTQKLRQRILDLAIRGKLVPQDPNDEPASVLLERIRAEKERLIAEGKIKSPKKSKSSSYESHYQNFEIPPTWVWTTLGEIFYMQAGKNIQASELGGYSENKPYPCYGGNGIRGYVSSYSHNGCYPIIGRQGALCGNVNLANGNFYATEHAVVVSYFCGTNVILWRYFLEFLNLNQHATATAQPGLSVAKIEEVPIPLPPIQEQSRIVEAIERWYKYIDQIECGTADLITGIHQAKTKILELAMQGKLVPQDPADEPAAEMLKRINPKAKIITDNPHSRNLPTNWVVCTLGDLLSVINGVSYGKGDIIIEDAPASIRILRGGNIQEGLLSLKADDIYVSYTCGGTNNDIRIGDTIMVASTGSALAIGKTAYIPHNYENVYIGAFLRILRPIHFDFAPYLGMFFKSNIYKSIIQQLAKGSNINNIKHSYITDMEIGLPPLNEQKRIVAKIEELYACLDEIEASLQS